MAQAAVATADYNEAGEGNDERVRQILADQSRMEAERVLFEPIYRDVDRYCDPFGVGAWDELVTPSRDVEELYDATAVDGLDRYTAAIAGITVPRQQRWHGLAFEDAALMKLDPVRLWCETATDALFARRYAPNAGFETQIHEDIRQEGKYGTSPLWVDEKLGAGIFYKTVHLSCVWIDENYYGRVDKVHRKIKYTVRQAVQQFGAARLSAKTRDLINDNKLDQKIEILHVVRPRGDYQRGQLGTKGKPVESIYLELGCNHIISEGGYYTMPLIVSRYSTGPNDKYGRSAGMKGLAGARTVNAMARTALDAANKAADPAILYYDDGEINALSSAPGEFLPMLDEQGHELMKVLNVAGELPVTLEMMNREREAIGKGFLEEFFRLLSDPSDRMTATQVIETLQKEGVLVAPYAGRRETEKLQPMIVRELDIGLRAGWIPPLPPEAREAGAFPKVVMTNPLSKMARAAEVSGFTRLAEIGIQLASAGKPEALDVLDVQPAMRDTAEVLGVRASHIKSADRIAAENEAKEQAQAGAEAAAVAPDAARAALDLAKANQISEQLGGGGGL